MGATQDQGIHAGFPHRFQILLCHQPCHRIVKIGIAVFHQIDVYKRQRIPYGSRSPETVLRYAKEDVAFLRQSACLLYTSCHRFGGDLNF